MLKVYETKTNICSLQTGGYRYNLGETKEAASIKIETASWLS